MATSKIKSKSERTALIQEFQASGMTKTAWCKEKGIACATFYKWLKSYEQEQQVVKFLPLTEPLKNIPLANELLVEVGICKVHITDATSITLLTKLIKAVNSADV